MLALLTSGFLSPAFRIKGSTAGAAFGPNSASAKAAWARIAGSFDSRHRFKGGTEIDPIAPNATDAFHRTTPPLSFGVWRGGGFFLPHWEPTPPGKEPPPPPRETPSGWGP